MEHISVIPFYASVCISLPSILDFPAIFIWNIFLHFHFGPLCVFLCPLYWIFHIFLPSGAGCVAWHCWGCWPALLLEQSFRKTTFSGFLWFFYDFLGWSRNHSGLWYPSIIWWSHDLMWWSSRHQSAWDCTSADWGKVHCTSPWTWQSHRHSSIGVFLLTFLATGS